MENDTHVPFYAADAKHVTLYLRNMSLQSVFTAAYTPGWTWEKVLSRQNLSPLPHAFLFLCFVLFVGRYQHIKEEKEEDMEKDLYNNCLWNPFLLKMGYTIWIHFHSIQCYTPQTIHSKPYGRHERQQEKKKPEKVFHGFFLTTRKTRTTID